MVFDNSDYINLCLSSSQLSLLQTLVQTKMSEHSFNPEISALWETLQISCSSEPPSPSPTINNGQDIVMSEAHSDKKEKDEANFV